MPVDISATSDEFSRRNPQRLQMLNMLMMKHCKEHAGLQPLTLPVASGRNIGGLREDSVHYSYSLYKFYCVTPIGLCNAKASPSLVFLPHLAGQIEQLTKRAEENVWE